MRILVITPEPHWVNAVRTAFTGGHDVVAGDPKHLAKYSMLLPVVDACFVAETETGSFTVETLKQISSAGDVAAFGLADSVRPEWEEAALIAGARQVFKAPLRPGVVQLAISRAARPATPSLPREALRPVTFPAVVDGRTHRELGMWREFSRLLAHPVSEPVFRNGYLTHLAESLGCGRLVLYVRRTPVDAVFEPDSAVGLDVRQFDGFRLHLGHGLGRLLVSRTSVVTRQRLRLDQPDEAVAAKEMMVFGAELAVPLMAGDGCVGILLVAPRIAGADYADSDITQIYHVMEAFAAAMNRVAEPVPSVAAAPTLFPAAFKTLPIGCALVDESLRVLEANEAFRSQLGADSASGIQRMPEAWHPAIRSLRDGRSADARVELEHDLSGAQRRIRLSLERLTSPDAREPRWLMVTEDITTEMRLREELHNRSLQNVLQRAGEQLSNEFRNYLTPIEILVQLSAESTSKRDFDRLRAPVGMAIHRLRRRVDNLAYLTKSSIVPESTTVSAVFRSARERLDNWLEPKQLKTLVWSGEFSRVAFTADTAALGLAIAELAVNAVEAAGGRQVMITADDLPEAVHFKVRNPGEWSPPTEETGFGPRPFVTKKSAGVGLGVEVVSRVAEHHGGRLALGPVAADVVEAIIRLPRTMPRLTEPVSTPVTTAL